MVDMDLLKRDLIRLKNANDKLKDRYEEAISETEWAEDIEKEFNYMQEKLKFLIEDIESIIRGF